MTCTLTLNNVTLLKLVRTKGNVEIVCNCEMGYLTHVKNYNIDPRRKVESFCYCAVQYTLRYLVSLSK